MSEFVVASALVGIIFPFALDAAGADVQQGNGKTTHQQPEDKPPEDWGTLALLHVAWAQRR
ncbi:MAG: hypothetical protein NZ739_03215 [Verrucomicrobiae bacterium]|nr:hypothetical protein [Verrucomicrobiae bacterium]MDW7980356.1 hypothetical protein [Verrucomicrobiales bacterium]